MTCLFLLRAVLWVTAAEYEFIACRPRVVPEEKLDGVEHGVWKGRVYPNEPPLRNQACSLLSLVRLVLPAEGVCQGNLLSHLVSDNYGMISGCGL